MDAHNRATLASELLVFHMQVSDEDVSTFVQRVSEWLSNNNFDYDNKTAIEPRDFHLTDQICSFADLQKPTSAESDNNTHTTYKLTKQQSFELKNSENEQNSENEPENSNKEPETANLAPKRPTRILPETAFDKFTYLSRHCPDKTLAVIQAICDLNFHKTFNVNLQTLCRFTLRVEKGYRDNPYHDWTHAFSVFHMSYLLVKNLNLQQLIGELPCFSLLVAALCHDLDHRGTNSAFESKSQSPLAALYSSKGSVMERHHFAQTVSLLNVKNCNIFSGMTAEENQKALDYVQSIILATDLKRHFDIFAELKVLAEEVTKVGIERFVEDKRCLVDGSYRKLEMNILSLLMTSSDLSDQTKTWATTKNTARNIYEEFFNQGDLEKDMGHEPMDMMNRDLACIPQVQVDFMENVALPVYETLAKIFPESCGEVFKRAELNKERWSCINKSWAESAKDVKARESMSILTNNFDQEVLEKLEAPVNPFV